MLINDLFQTFSGSRIWRKSISYDFSDKLVLVFPDGCTAISYFGLLYADEYANEINKNGIIIISNNCTIPKAAEVLVKLPQKAVTLSEKEMNALLQYLSLCVDLQGESIYDNVKFMSEYYPYHGTISILNECGIFSEAYLTWNRIFHRKTIYYAPDPKTVPPTGNFDDDELNAFMHIGFVK